MIRQELPRESRRPLSRCSQGLTVALTIAAVALLCFLLYHYDNQYTSPYRQPSDGVLDLRQEELPTDGHPYHLQKDWEFYPDVLLDPDADFSRYPHHLLSLGKSNSSARSECGTYRLTLLLPSTPMAYALKLPATYSAYRCYVDQDLLLEVGHPGEETSSQHALAKEQLISFRASGRVQLLIHYSDKAGNLSGLSGLSAPPILGRPLRVYNLIASHQLFLAICVIPIFLTLLLSINIFLRSRQRDNLSMIALCLCSMIYLAYPLVRSILIFPAYPWYTLEILCYFCCHAAAHWGYTRHYGWDSRIDQIMKWSVVGLVGLCAVLLLALPFLPGEKGWMFFYVSTRILQWGAVLSGIFLTVRIVISRAPGPLLGAASVTLWTFMLAELTLPDFSPVVFARFPEMGIICFMGLSILVEYLDIASAHQFRLLYAQKIAHTEQMLKLEERHYAQLSVQLDASIRFRHDLRQHLRLIRSLLDQGDTAALADYLEQYSAKVQPLLAKPLTFFYVPIADALLAHYWTAAQKRGAEFQISGQLHMLPPTVYVDFCSIMGNLLENALDALDRQPPGHPKWIHVRCDILQQKLMLEVINSNSVPVRQEEGRLYSTKRDEPGIGTFSISLIAQQYGGFSSFFQEGDHFTARVLLPLGSKDEGGT